MMRSLSQIVQTAQRTVQRMKLPTISVQEPIVTDKNIIEICEKQYMDIIAKINEKKHNPLYYRGLSKYTVHKLEENGMSVTNYGKEQLGYTTIVLCSSVISFKTGSPMIGIATCVASIFPFVETCGNFDLYKIKW